MESAIEIRDLTVRYQCPGGSVEALKKLNLAVPRGTIVGFLGPNGAGKTTTINVLMGFTGATSGTATIMGRDVKESISRERIGYLPEHPELYKFLSGRELLDMVGRLFLLDKAARRAAIARTLDLLAMADAADRRIATYSRGMMQRIGLAQALINDPDLLILDEPTGGLDPVGRMLVRKVISGLKSAGKTVFFSSHELSEVEMVCDRVAILSGGELVAEGRVADLVGGGERLEQYFLRVVDRKDPDDSGSGAAA